MFNEFRDSIAVQEREEPIEKSLVEFAVAEALKVVDALPSRHNPAYPEQAKEKLTFHNVPHTESVIRRFTLIIDTLIKLEAKISQRDKGLGVMSAGSHDVAQDFVEWQSFEPEGHPYQGYEKVMRKRSIKVNEKNSAVFLIGVMRKVNEDSPGTFTEEDEDKVTQAIEVTVPGYDVQTNTLTQPNLHKESIFIEIALALADLGAAGIDGPELFLKEGDALFIEENLDIADAVEGLRRGKEISKKNKEYYRWRMLVWTESQEKFASDRERLLETQLQSLSKDEKKSLKDNVFTRFAESIEGAKKQTKMRKELSFEDLAKNMGYSLDVLN